MIAPAREASPEEDVAAGRAALLCLLEVEVKVTALPDYFILDERQKHNRITDWRPTHDV